MKHPDLEQKLTINPEELKKILDFKSRGEQFLIELGSLQMELLSLNKRKKDLENRFLDFKSEEQNFMVMMDYKYGNVNLDLKTGVITPRDQLTENNPN